MNELRRRLVIAVLGSALVLTALGAAAGPQDLYNAGRGEESAQGYGVDAPDLVSGTTYRASTFPLRITFRATDALWGGGQAQRGRFRFVVLLHKYGRDAKGEVSVWGFGAMALEAGVGKTGSMAATAKRLHGTPRIQAGPLTSARVAGYRAMSFDATVVGKKPGYGGIPFIPFTRNPRPGGDHFYVQKGSLLRILVVDVRGKTVVIFLQSADASQHPERSFPVFLTFANRMLGTMSFPR